VGQGIPGRGALEIVLLEKRVAEWWNKNSVSASSFKDGIEGLTKRIQWSMKLILLKTNTS